MPSCSRPSAQMRTPTYLASRSSRSTATRSTYEQEQFLRDFLRRAAAGPVRPTSIRQETDSKDNVVRRWPREREGLPPLIANALTADHPEFRAYTRSIDFRLPGTAENDETPVFANLPIQIVPDRGRGAALRRSKGATS